MLSWLRALVLTPFLFKMQNYSSECFLAAQFLSLSYATFCSSRLRATSCTRGDVTLRADSSLGTRPVRLACLRVWPLLKTEQDAHGSVLIARYRRVLHQVKFLMWFCHLSFLFFFLYPRTKHSFNAMTC